MTKISKRRLMELAGLDIAPSPTSVNAFHAPGHMAKVNQAQEIRDVLGQDEEDTVPSDDIEEVESELLAVDFD